MSLLTSSLFSSTAATGTDWRDCARSVLEKLEGVRTEGYEPNFGFLYITDHLADDAQSILNLFKSVLNIEHWIGGVALGVCASGESLIDVPAISVMIGQFAPEDFCMIPPVDADGVTDFKTLGPWLEKNQPMLTVVHGDPMADQDPAISLKNLEEFCCGFAIGGLTSSRKIHAQFCDELYEGELCGAVFSDRIKVASTLSQGCAVIGGPYTVTRCDGHTVFELDSQKAVPVFETCIRSMAIRATGKDPDTIMVDEDAENDKSLIPEEFHAMLQGEVHAALPISESDKQDYLVRNIIGLDAERGSLTIAQDFQNGQNILFVHRDHKSVYADLSSSLVALRQRIQHEHGAFEPKGGIYVSCVARAFDQFEGDLDNEMALIRHVIGDIPLTGFYAGGEICRGQLYGYTGVLTLFL